MTTQNIAGHDNTKPAFQWQGLQVFAEGEEGGAGDAGTAADANSGGAGGGNNGDAGAGGDNGASAAGDAGDGTTTGQEGDKDATDKGATDKPDVPDKYDLTIPDGFTVEEGLMTEFTGVAKELGLNNDQANKLVGMHTKVMQDAFQALNEARTQEVVSWGEASKQELGKNYDTVLHDVALGVEAIEREVPTLREAMNKTGFGNTIEGIRLMAIVGKVFGEDQGGKDNGGKNATGEDVGKLFFPNSQK